MTISSPRDPNIQMQHPPAIPRVVCLALALTLAQGVNCARNAKSHDFTSPCGTAQQVAQRLGACASETFDLIYGNVKAPNNDHDIQENCNRFTNTERCIRTLAKECLTGFHRTSAGTVASAAKRWRQTECKSEETRAKYIEPVRCLVRHGAETRKLYQQITGIGQGIRELKIEPEEKMKKMCCLIDKMNADIEKLFTRNCPQQADQILNIVRAMTDDSKKTLCTRPRCTGASLAEVLNHKHTPPQSFVEPIMEVVFEMGA